MEYLLIGKYVNTHGIKGEIRVLSDFKFKEQVFIPGVIVYIGKNKHKFIIKSYRKHKEFDMLTFEDVFNINSIEFLKGSSIYINKDDLALDENFKLVEDLLGYNVYVDDTLIGDIKEIINGKDNDILVVSDKRLLIPYVKEYILKIDSPSKRIDVLNVKGLL
ncbi:MAG: ribosome maturation factor RimM [Bacilli bacterium]|nr:ribosome maturation factor RimM [Bacilli bacterium]